MIKTRADATNIHAVSPVSTPSVIIAPGIEGNTKAKTTTAARMAIGT